MTLRKQFENRPVGSILVIAILVAGGTWVTLNELLVRPRDEEFGRLERRLDELKEQASIVSAGRNRSSTLRGEAEPEIPRKVQSNLTAHDAEVARGSGGELIKTGAPNTAPDPSQRRAVPIAQGFQTESYNLRIENIQRTGTAVEVDLLLESQKGEAFRFALSEPYMLDSQGLRLDILRDESGGFVGRGVEVLPNTRLRGSLLFCVMTKPSTIRVGGFAGSSPACTGESVEGREFTLAADEVFPQTRRKVILRSTEGG